MIFKELSVIDAYLIEFETMCDERGYFKRTFCKDVLKEKHIEFEIVQCNTSFNAKQGTLRGMHYQRKPHEEAKLVQCIQGSLYDVIVDMRPESATYLKWCSVNLSEKAHSCLYIPRGCAHGFITLEDETVVHYYMSEVYHPESASGFRYDDTKVNIVWPDVEITAISKKDLAYAPL